MTPTVILIGFVWLEENTTLWFWRAVTTQQGGHHTINSFLFPKWRKEMAANPSVVSPLCPHLRLSTDLPLPLGKLTTTGTCGWPPYAQSNMLTGRNQRGENQIVKTSTTTCCWLSVQLPLFLRPGMRTNPSPGKWLQLDVMLITIAQNKSQAEKSLDGNCYNCPNNRNEYFFLLNYMWLNI